MWNKVVPRIIFALMLHMSFFYERDEKMKNFKELSKESYYDNEQKYVDYWKEIKSAISKAIDNLKENYPSLFNKKTK